MKRPEEGQLSRKDGEAWRTRLAGEALTAAARRVLDQVLQWYCWLLFVLQEAPFSLKRLRAILCGDKPKQRQSPSSSGSSDGSDGAGDVGAASTAVRGATVEAHRAAGSAGGHRPGHGRQGAAAYPGAERVTCRQRPWRWASAVRSVARGGSRRYRPGWTSASMATRCSRPSTMSWRSCAARHGGRCARRSCPLEPGRSNTARRHGRCWR